MVGISAITVKGLAREGVPTPEAGDRSPGLRLSAFRPAACRSSASWRDWASSRPLRSQTSPCSSKRPSIEASVRNRTRARVSAGIGLGPEVDRQLERRRRRERRHHAERRRPPRVRVEGDQLGAHLAVAARARSQPPVTASVAAGERHRAPDRTRLELLEDRRRARADAERLDLVGRRRLRRLRLPAHRRLVVGAEHAERERHRPARPGSAAPSRCSPTRRSARRSPRSRPRRPPAGAGSAASASAAAAPGRRPRRGSRAGSAPR